jgi:uncharacterized membrane protein YhaH (DUF805 family)/DNA-directed RNA polymerase subunit RPC12/RpoP
MQGMIVECPHCELRIRIPQAPEVRPESPAAERPAHRHIVVKPQPPSLLSPKTRTRECPYCGGVILAVAGTCGHCNASVTPLIKTKRHYGGVGRLGYWLAPCVFFFVTVVVGAVLGLFASATCRGNAQGLQNLAVGFSLVWGLVSLVFFVCLALYRLRNMGMSRWCVWLFVVPFVNLGIGLACACFPEGYGDSKKLDVPAMVLMAIYIVLLAGFACVTVLTPGIAEALKR